MNLIQTDFNISKIKNKTFDKKVSAPVVKFRGQETEYSFPDYVPVNPDLTKTYFGISEHSSNNSSIKKLTDEEFEKMRATAKHIADINYNKYNVQLADKLPSYENISSYENAVYVMKNVTNQYNFEVAEKILSDENLLNNEVLMNSVASVLYFTNSPEKAENKIKMLEQISTDERFEEKDFLNYSVSVLKTNYFTEQDLLQNVVKLVDMKVNDGGKEVPRFNTTDIIMLGRALNDLETKGIVLELVNLPVKTDEQKNIIPTADDILKYTDLYVEDYENRRILENPEVQKCVMYNSKKLKSVNSFSSDKFLELHYKDKVVHYEIKDDGTLEVTGEEVISEKDGKKTTELKTKGASIKLEQYFDKEGDIKGYIETLSDKDGNPVSRTLTKRSKKNPGVLVVLKEVLDKKGGIKEVKKLGTVENYGEKDDKRVIKTEFTSPLGTESKQSIMETPHIKSSKFEAVGKRFERRFRQYDDHSSDTVAWGNLYRTKINLDGIDVTVTRKDGTTETATVKNCQMSYQLRPLIAQISGDYLYLLAKTGTKVCYGYEKDNACFDPDSNTICVSEELKNDPFIFMHELGHMADEVILGNLNKDSELQEIFKRELDAYKEQASVLSEEQIQYFVAKKHSNIGGCLTEVIAETNAILSGLQHEGDGHQVLIRSKILQENFPETISYIGSKIEEEMQEL
ncbi:hypothetical protein IJI31_04555 [bacterium]|nr:hypothetical protein [bacterium]